MLQGSNSPPRRDGLTNVKAVDQLPKQRFITSPVTMRSRSPKGRQSHGTWSDGKLLAPSSLKLTFVSDKAYLKTIELDQGRPTRIWYSSQRIRQCHWEIGTEPSLPKKLQTDTWWWVRKWKRKAEEAEEKAKSRKVICILAFRRLDTIWVGTQHGLWKRKGQILLFPLFGLLFCTALARLLRLVWQESSNLQSLSTNIGDMLETISMQHDSSVPSANNNHHVPYILSSKNRRGR